MCKPVRHASLLDEAVKRITTRVRLRYRHAVAYGLRANGVRLGDKAVSRARATGEESSGSAFGFVATDGEADGVEIEVICGDDQIVSVIEILQQAGRAGHRGDDPIYIRPAEIDADTAVGAPGRNEPIFA